MNSAIPATGISPQASHPAIIAGQHAGKPIYCAPEIYPLFQELEKAGRRGSHWARIAIKELGSLTTGHIGKNNVFVEESPHLRRNVTQFHTKDNPYIKHSITLFYAFLPGLQATIAQRPDGSYFVVDLQLDGRYFKATEKKQPGLYEVRRSSSEAGWQVEYKKSGRIEQKDYRAVAISDTDSSDPARAANIAADSIVGALGAGSQRQVDAEGFDLHFTPGQRRLGTLISYDASQIESTHGTAVHLADTMMAARSTASVRWVSVYGGSAIFTQAMKVLAARGSILKGHEAYLYRPRTSPGDAVRLAHQLEFALAEDVAKTGFDIVGGASMRRVAGARLQQSDEVDLYNAGAHNKAVAMGVGKGASVVGVVMAAGVVTGGAFPMVAAVAKALATATGGISGLLTLGALAQHVAEPHAHKLKSKRIGKG